MITQVKALLLYIRLPYFHVSNSALFSTKYFSILILYRRSLDTFYWHGVITWSPSKLTTDK